MKKETKKRIQKVLKISKTAFHWGFIPLIIYLGRKTFPIARACSKCEFFGGCVQTAFKILTFIFCCYFFRIKTRRWTRNARANIAEVSKPFFSEDLWWASEEIHFRAIDCLVGRVLQWYSLWETNRLALLIVSGRIQKEKGIFVVCLRLTRETAFGKFML